MTVFVDEPVLYPSRPNGFPYWCHMWTDSSDIEELHAMAKRIGLKHGWFQPGASVPHYDLVKSKREEALKEGAVEGKIQDQVQKVMEARRLARAIKTEASGGSAPLPSSPTNLRTQEVLPQPPIRSLRRKADQPKA